MKELLRRLRYLWNRRHLEEELANEMEFHREMAAREGHGQFGNTLLLREEARDAWGWTWLDRLGQDLRYALRMLRKSPGFTLAAILMLAIGIGVNVAAFSFFDLLMLRPLKVRDPATLLRFHRRSPQNYAFALPYPEMAYFREHSRTLSTVLALNSTRVSVEGEEKPLSVHFVTDNYLADLGATATLGRIFGVVQDKTSDGEPIVVLDYRFWQHHFGSDPLVVGKTIHLNGKPVTIVGVAPSSFNGLSMESPAMWAPLSRQPYVISGSRLLTDFSVDSSGVSMWGRMQPGMLPKLAEEELRGLAAELHKVHALDVWDQEDLPCEPGGYAQSLTIGNRHGTGRESRDELFPVFASLASLALLILAVACGNLGSLLLARSVAREREIAIRVAVGAGRVRLLRQLFTESLLLGLIGSAAGLLLGCLLLRGVVATGGGAVWMDPTPDWPVTFFAGGMGLLSTVLFGLTPALQAARQRHRATVMRRILVSAQVAASCVLLIVAGLLVRAFEHAVSNNPGFAYQQLISIDPHLATHGYSPARARAYLDTLQGRLRALPGVQAVAVSDTAPLGNRVSSTRIETDGHVTDVLLNRVDPGLFETLSVPILRGRNLRRGDTNAAVISESMAQRLWPGKDPLGQKFDFMDGRTVVGVAGTARLVRLEDPDMVQVYFLNQESDLPSMVVVVRTLGSPETLLREAAAVAKSVDPALYPDVQLLKSTFRRKLEPAERLALGVSLLGSIAHLLACLGIVGLVAYAVSQRTKDIGIRVALGARPPQVMSAVLRQFVLPVLAGLVLGIGGAAGLTQFLRHQLYGISNLDPVTYFAAVGIFSVTVALAALLPARQALRVDPMLALRQD